MLRDLPHQRLAIGVGHPVLGLDFAVGVDDRVETRLLGRTGSRVERGDVAGNVEGLRVHGERSRPKLSVFGSINQPTGRLMIFLRMILGWVQSLRWVTVEAGGAMRAGIANARAEQR